MRRASSLATFRCFRVDASMESVPNAVPAHKSMFFVGPRSSSTEVQLRLNKLDTISQYPDRSQNSLSNYQNKTKQQQQSSNGKHSNNKQTSSNDKTETNKQTNKRAAARVAAAAAASSRSNKQTNSSSNDKAATSSSNKQQQQQQTKHRKSGFPRKRRGQVSV